MEDDTMSNKNWMVVVNKECTITGGDRISCNSKSESLNVAALVARSLYNVDARESHVFVVKREKADVELPEFIKNVVKYHYSIVRESGLKMILLYDGFCGNQKRIATQWLDEQGK